jgi:glycosyltransferase involved in cell wall biosynthesis
MNILFITECFPYPLDSGGKIVSHQMIKMLSSQHDVHLVALTNKAPSKNERSAISSLGVKITLCISKKAHHWYKQSKHEILKSLIRLKPPVLYSFYEKRFMDQVNMLLKTQRFDIVHIDHLSMAQYLPETKMATQVLQEHNIEYKLYRDFYHASPKFSKEWFLHYCNSLMLWRFERNILGRADQIILLSKQDQSELTALGIPKNKTLVIPPYVASIKSKSKACEKGKELLFIGNMWWKPNRDAMIWFLEKIFPLVLKGDSSVRLTVIGEGVNLLTTYSRCFMGVHLVEKPKNITPYLKRASAFILPFRIGQGVRIKALSATSYSVPIVSTAIGMRGMETHPGVEYLGAETPLEFTSQILKLMHQPDTQKLLTKNMNKLLQTFHNPTAIKSHLLKHYGKING